MYAFFGWLIFYLIISAKGHFQDDEDAELLVPELILKYGYQSEENTVVTEDGYVLTMFRILPTQQMIVKKKPVIMVHGLLSSSADFVISGPNISLAYLLSDHGYDIWLANMRGSRYSRNHLRLPVESKEYWDFSWHELGLYDLPAMIDHVLNVTNSRKLIYIGHSQGVTEYFVMTSMRPEYNDKIALMSALSPAVSQTHFRSPILRFAKSIADTIKKTLEAHNIYEFLPFSKIYRSACLLEPITDLCIQLYGLMFGPNHMKTDPQLVLRYLGHFPQGASFKQLMHYFQVENSGGHFQQFNYGRKGNLERYNRSEPPPYNLTASTAPVLIYYGLNDWMVHPEDAQRFSQMLPRVIAAIPVADRKFNHMDFVLSTNVRKMLYERLLSVLDKYS